MEENDGNNSGGMVYSKNKEMLDGKAKGREEELLTLG